jgi:hypothetical protein
MLEFSQPLIDAAKGDHKAINNALQLGMTFWNLGAVAETGDDEFVREQLSMLDNMSARTGGDAREFRAIVAMMLGRYAAMRPAARACLERGIAGAWGADLSSAMPKLGLAGRIAGAAKKMLSRGAQDSDGSSPAEQFSGGQPKESDA